MKRKTITELEKKLKVEMWYGMVVTILLVLAVVCFVTYFQMDAEYRSQLKECQENKTIIHKSCVTTMSYQPCNRTSGNGYYDCSKFKEVENCEVINP